MKIEILSLTEKAVEEGDYRDVMEIRVNDKRVFRVC